MLTVVSAKGLSVTFGDGFKALEGINLELPAGKITGLIGPSGAGKTTLIRVIVGRQKISGGRVEVLDTPAGSATLRGRFSYMTQSLSVYPDLTVTENLMFFARMIGLKHSKLRQSVSEVLRQVDLAPQASKMVNDLSGGQRQRVSLGVALLGDPQLLVLDEPTVGLDPVLREQLWNLFHQLVAQGKSIIVSSHVMDEADRCDDLVLIRGGKVLAHSSPDEFCSKTQTKTVEQGFIKLVGAKT